MGLRIRTHVSSLIAQTQTQNNSIRFDPGLAELSPGFSTVNPALMQFLQASPHWVLTHALARPAMASQVLR